MNIDPEQNFTGKKKLCDPIMQSSYIDLLLLSLCVINSFKNLMTRNIF